MFRAFMTLRVIRIRQRVGEQIPVLRVVVHIVSQRGYDGAIKSLHLAVRLRMVGAHGHVLDTKKCAELLE